MHRALYTPERLEAILPFQRSNSLRHRINRHNLNYCLWPDVFLLKLYDYPVVPIALYGFALNMVCAGGPWSASVDRPWFLSLFVVVVKAQSPQGQDF